MFSRSFLFFFVASNYSTCLGLIRSIEAEEQRPFTIPLRRESVPVKRQNRTVSFKTSYSGLIHVGSPPVEYRVVFDTGSGHVILPDSKCATEACTTKKRFDLGKSTSGNAIFSNMTHVPAGQPRPSVQVGFGTGGINGEFVGDVVCTSPKLGGNDPHGENTLQSNLANQIAKVGIDSDLKRGCVRMGVLSAIEMSSNPFKYFKFDGILGLGLSRLAIANTFNFVHMLSKSSHVASSRFGVFLTEGEDGEESEIAFGGYDTKRLLSPVTWNKVARQAIGYWQVQIKAIRVNGEELDVCKDGDCRGVVDTGTSHLGLPSPYDKQINPLLQQSAGDLVDCRLSQGATIEFELDSTVLTLEPKNYMRRLPIREGVQVGSANGVTDGTPASGENAANPNKTGNYTRPKVQLPILDTNSSNVTRHCRPRTLSVNLSYPVGPKLFILGEPVLHKYYTVYDYEKMQVGFGLANNKANTAPPPDPDFKGYLPEDVELLLQARPSVISKDGDLDEDVELLMQDGITIGKDDDDFEEPIVRLVEVEVMVCAMY